MRHLLIYRGSDMMVVLVTVTFFYYVYDGFATYGFERALAIRGNYIGTLNMHRLPDPDPVTLCVFIIHTLLLVCGLAFYMIIEVCGHSTFTQTVLPPLFLLLQSTLFPFTEWCRGTNNHSGLFFYSIYIVLVYTLTGLRVEAVAFIAGWSLISKICTACFLGQSGEDIFQGIVITMLFHIAGLFLYFRTYLLAIELLYSEIFAFQEARSLPYIRELEQKSIDTLSAQYKKAIGWCSTAAESNSPTYYNTTSSTTNEKTPFLYIQSDILETPQKKYFVSDAVNSSGFSNELHSPSQIMKGHETLQKPFIQTPFTHHTIHDPTTLKHLQDNVLSINNQDSLEYTCASHKSCSNLDKLPQINQTLSSYDTHNGFTRSSALPSPPLNSIQHLNQRVPKCYDSNKRFSFLPSSTTHNEARSPHHSFQTSERFKSNWNSDCLQSNKKSKSFFGSEINIQPHISVTNATEGLGSTHHSKSLNNDTVLNNQYTDSSTLIKLSKKTNETVKNISELRNKVLCHSMVDNNKDDSQSKTNGLYSDLDCKSFVHTPEDCITDTMIHDHDCDQIIHPLVPSTPLTTLFCNGSMESEYIITLGIGLDINNNNNQVLDSQSPQIIKKTPVNIAPNFSSHFNQWTHSPNSNLEEHQESQLNDIHCVESPIQCITPLNYIEQGVLESDCCNTKIAGGCLNLCQHSVSLPILNSTKTHYIHKERIADCDKKNLVQQQNNFQDFELRLIDTDHQLTVDSTDKKMCQSSDQLFQKSVSQNTNFHPHHLEINKKDMYVCNRSKMMLQSTTPHQKTIDFQTSNHEASLSKDIFHWDITNKGQDHTQIVNHTESHNKKKAKRSLHRHQLASRTVLSNPMTSTTKRYPILYSKNKRPIKYKQSSNMDSENPFSEQLLQTSVVYQQILQQLGRMHVNHVRSDVESYRRHKILGTPNANKQWDIMLHCSQNRLDDEDIMMDGVTVKYGLIGYLPFQKCPNSEASAYKSSRLFQSSRNPTSLYDQEHWIVLGNIQNHHVGLSRAEKCEKIQNHRRYIGCITCRTDNACCLTKPHKSQLNKQPFINLTENVKNDNDKPSKSLSNEYSYMYTDNHLTHHKNPNQALQVDTTTNSRLPYCNIFPSEQVIAQPIGSHLFKSQHHYSNKNLSERFFPHDIKSDNSLNSNCSIHTPTRLDTSQQCSEWTQSNYRAHSKLAVNTFVHNAKSSDNLWDTTTTWTDDCKQKCLFPTKNVTPNKHCYLQQNPHTSHLPKQHRNHPLIQHTMKMKDHHNKKNIHSGQSRHTTELNKHHKSFCQTKRLNYPVCVQTNKLHHLSKTRIIQQPDTLKNRFKKWLQKRQMNLQKHQHSFYRRIIILGDMMKYPVILHFLTNCKFVMDLASWNSKPLMPEQQRTSFAFVHTAYETWFCDWAKHTAKSSINLLNWIQCIGTLLNIIFMLICFIWIPYRRPNVFTLLIIKPSLPWRPIIQFAYICPAFLIIDVTLLLFQINSSKHHNFSLTNQICSLILFNRLLFSLLNMMYYLCGTMDDLLVYGQLLLNGLISPLGICYFSSLQRSLFPLSAVCANMLIFGFGWSNKIVQLQWPWIRMNLGFGHIWLIIYMLYFRSQDECRRRIFCFCSLPYMIQLMNIVNDLHDEKRYHVPFCLALLSSAEPPCTPSSVSSYMKHIKTGSLSRTIKKSKQLYPKSPYRLKDAPPQYYIHHTNSSRKSWLHTSALMAHNKRCHCNLSDCSITDDPFTKIQKKRLSNSFSHRALSDSVLRHSRIDHTSNDRHPSQLHHMSLPSTHWINQNIPQTVMIPKTVCDISMNPCRHDRNLQLKETSFSHHLYNKSMSLLHDDEQTNILNHKIDDINDLSTYPSSLLCSTIPLDTTVTHPSIQADQQKDQLSKTDVLPSNLLVLHPLNHDVILPEQHSIMDNLETSQHLDNILHYIDSKLKHSVTSADTDSDIGRSHDLIKHSIDQSSTAGSSFWNQTECYVSNTTNQFEETGTSMIPPLPTLHHSPFNSISRNNASSNDTHRIDSPLFLTESIHQRSYSKTKLIKTIHFESTINKTKLLEENKSLFKGNHSSENCDTLDTACQKSRYHAFENPQKKQQLKITSKNEYLLNRYQPDQCSNSNIQSVLRQSTSCLGYLDTKKSSLNPFFNSLDFETIHSRNMDDYYCNHMHYNNSQKKYIYNSTLSGPDDIDCHQKQLFINQNNLCIDGTTYNCFIDKSDIDSTRVDDTLYWDFFFRNWDICGIYRDSSSAVHNPSTCSLFNKILEEQDQNELKSLYSINNLDFSRCLTPQHILLQQVVPSSFCSHENVQLLRRFHHSVPSSYTDSSTVSSILALNSVSPASKRRKHCNHTNIIFRSPITPSNQISNNTVEMLSDQVLQTLFIKQTCWDLALHPHQTETNLKQFKTNQDIHHSYKNHSIYNDRLMSDPDLCNDSLNNSNILLGQRPICDSEQTITHQNHLTNAYSTNNKDNSLNTHSSVFLYSVRDLKELIYASEVINYRVNSLQCLTLPSTIRLRKN